MGITLRSRVTLLVAFAVTASAARVALAQDLGAAGFGVEAHVNSGWTSRAQRGERFNEFLLDRGELSALFGTPRATSAHLTTAGVFGVEAVRSGGPQSGYGIDGDSIVARVHRAWAGVRVAPRSVIAVDLVAGLLEDPWRLQNPSGGASAPFGRLGSERHALFTSADLGAELTLALFDRRARLSLGFTNGEGVALPEQNGGKNLTASATVDLLPQRFAAWTLKLHALVRHGSVGIGEARNHRYAVGLTFETPWPRGGLEWVEAWGYVGRTDLRARVASAWVESELGTRWLGVAAWFDALDPSRDTPNDQTLRAGGAVYSDVARAEPDDPARHRVRLIVGFEQERVEDSALTGSGQALTTNSVFARIALDARLNVANPWNHSP